MAPPEARPVPGGTAPGGGTATPPAAGGTEAGGTEAVPGGGTVPGARPDLAAVFTESMAHLASAVAVVTARQDDGAPCGLLVSSVCSYSVAPPSVLLTVAASARAYAAFTTGAPFGVHVLGGADSRTAEAFARSGADKFASVRWSWDGPVPRLADVPWYLGCVAAAVFPHGDHAVVIGEVVRCVRDAGNGREPLVYYRRRLGWQLAAPAEEPGPARRPGRAEGPGPEPGLVQGPSGAAVVLR
ncbi:flavin reductase family protein [Streptomyces sp. NPDC021224]|uniref:flavin reductase family protein n=1 Tax=unclassified Streptomyces TaxID=2593676 RepID=UPI0037B2F5D0